jgi:hypothetical protein
MPDTLALFLQLPGDMIGYCPDLSRRRTARDNKIVANVRHLTHIYCNYIERFLVRRSTDNSQDLCFSFYVDLQIERKTQLITRVTRMSCAAAAKYLCNQYRINLDDLLITHYLVHACAASNAFALHS